MKKDNKLKLYIFAAGALLAFNTSVFAEISNVNVSKDIETKTATVTAKVKENNLVTIHILPENITPEQIEENPELGKSTGYVRNNIADDAGKVEFSFSIDEGIYNLYLKEKSTELEEPYKERFIMVGSETYEEFIGEITAMSKSDFLERVKNNKDILGFDIDIYSDSAVERFYDEYKDSLSKTDYELNLNNFKKCALVESINSKKDADVFSYIKKIYSEDKEFSEILNKYVTDEESKEFYNEVINNKNLKSSDDLETAAKEALILTAVKFEKEPIDLKEVLGEYKEIAGIKSVTSYASVYRKLAGKSYSDIDEFSEAYKELTDTDSGSSSTGGGGNGGGGNKVKPSGGGQGIIAPTSQSGQMQNKAIFDDIESVLWAKDAIEGLYKKGIVSGKGDGLFYPQDFVKREEFVKMMVEAFDLTLKGNEMTFSDVKEGEWYYDYIRIAHLARAVNGVDEVTFGVGQNITRQDICTIVLRMMRECDIVIPEKVSEKEFTDGAEVADYAKEAVSVLSKAGIINGDDLGGFNPKSFATRAETAKIIYGILNFI